MSVLYIFLNVPSSTYIMQNKSNSIPDEKMLDWWLTNCPGDLGELSLRVNWYLLGPRDVHSSYSVSAKAIIKKRNSTGVMLYPCLTPTFKSMDVSTLSLMSLTMLFPYMRLIADHIIGGAPYSPRMATSSA